MVITRARKTNTFRKCAPPSWAIVELQQKVGGTKDWRAVYFGVIREEYHTMICPEAKDRSEAEELAEARIRKDSFNFITGQGKVEGDAKLTAGAIVEIKGTGHRYDGEYIANEVIHELGDGGYITKFQLKRNMISEEAAKILNPGGMRTGIQGEASASSVTPAETQDDNYGDEEAVDGPEFRSLKWKKGGKEISEASVDDKVSLYCEVKNIPDGEKITFSIFEHLEDSDYRVVELEGTVKGGTVEVPWEIRNYTGEIEEYDDMVSGCFFVVKYNLDESHQSKELRLSRGGASERGIPRYPHAFDTAQGMIAKLMNNRHSTIFVNAPYQPTRRDPVEEMLLTIEQRNRSTVLHPANEADLEIALNSPFIRGDGFVEVQVIIFSGGHGDRRSPGVLGGLDFRKIRVENNNLRNINAFFPDCELGTEPSLRILRASLGGGVNIRAFNFRSYANAVADFISRAAIAQQYPQINENLIPRFRQIRRVVARGLFRQEVLPQ